MEERRSCGRLAAVIVSCALPMVATVAHAGPQTLNFFFRKDVACRVHVVQHPTTANPSTVANKSWHDICDVGNYPGSFTPSVQYPGIPACPGFTTWPRCDSNHPVVPDLGFRYPLVANVQATRIYQDLSVDWWSVCANANLTTIQSIPGVQDCGSDPLFQEIGRCRASAAYYENLNNSGNYPGERFYDFLATHPDCAPCGHEFQSAVETCKATCQHYFYRLGFDQDGSDPLNPGFGVWRDEDDPAWNGRPAGKQFADVALRSRAIAAGPYAGKTALQACNDFCGPPNAARSAPPWVSKNVGTQRPAAEKSNQWYWVLYDRPRNPNDNLSGTLRSYAVNTDHSSPTPECNGPIISRYCDTIITEPSGGGTVTQKRTQCKKNLLPAAVDLDDDGQPDGEVVLGEWNLTDDGFCNAFSHANMFCRDICYEAGGNGEVTDNVCGFVDPQTGLKLQTGLIGGDCDPKTAVCQCNNGLGQTVSCISLCGDGPGAAGETGLQCDDGNVLDHDCCAANCLYEAVGGACEADGNGCTTGTCNGSHQCVESCQVGALCAPAGCGLVCQLDGGGNCVCQ
jgi:hypothetical protein